LVLAKSKCVQCNGLKTRARPQLVRFAFAGFAAMLPISAAVVGTSMQTFNRLMIFQNWI